LDWLVWFGWLVGWLVGFSGSRLPGLQCHLVKGVYFGVLYAMFSMR